MSLRIGTAPLAAGRATAPLLLVLVLALAIGMGAIPARGQDSVGLVGAGSTVPLPLYKSWSLEYNNLKQRTALQYQPLGTTEGLRLLSTAKGGLGQADFAAGEVLLTEPERAQGDLVELPAVIIAIAPVYNLPGLSEQLKFSGDLLAQIFMGNVKNWNSPQIAKLNPGVTLPNLPITVFYRPAGKGTNFVFTDFLSKTSAEFRNRIGRSASPKWPVGTKEERSSDMADAVKAQPGSIGYVEAQYAVGQGISPGLVQNSAGRFVRPSNDAITAACAAIEQPQWNKFAASLTNAPGKDSYPITSFTWIYVHKSAVDPRRRAALNDLLNWIYSTGQQIATRQGYVDLPPQLLEKVRPQIRELK